jgi:5'-3' exonuclease
MILVDNSYAVYFNGFACWNWYSREIGTKGIPTDGSFDPMTDPEYKAMFKKKFLSRIHNVVQNDVIFFDKSELVFCLDCSKKNIWRNDIFPEYKMLRRTKKKERKFSWSGIFNYVNDILLPEYQEKYGCLVFQHPSAEGDDIIATLTNYFYDENICRELIIIASDGDITQLSDKAKIITLKGEIKSYSSVMEKHTKKYKADLNFEWTPELFLIHKSIMGDGGDEIPAIKSGIGPKRALDYINNIEQLEKLFSENEDAKKKFEINTKLINFDYIPELIRNNVIEQYNITKTNDLINL